MNRKVVLADSDSLGPINEVHLQFQLGKVVFHNRFIILVNLKQDIILSLPWQSNYKIGCNWNRVGKHFITIKSQFLALSIAPHVMRQLAKTKGQCHIQHRSITWITVQKPQNLNNNGLYEITLGRKLPTSIIPLDVILNLNHKQPGKLIIPLLNVGHTTAKLPKNTILGSINQIDNVDSVHEVSWEKIQDAKNEATSNTAQDHQTQKLLPAFPKCCNFQIHANNNSKPAITLQDAHIPQDIRGKLHHMINTKFVCIVSKSSTDFGRTNLVEMDLPTTGLPVASKPYTIPLKYKLFVDEEIKLLEDAGCISESFSDWVSPICIVKKKPDPSQPNKLQLRMCIDYRKVNQSLIATHNNNNGKVVSTFPLPKIQELLSRLIHCKYFSSLDISLTEEAK